MEVRMTLLVVLISMAVMPVLSQAIDYRQIRQLAAEYNVTCMLVFGDSSVDPGNNNRIPLTPKGNFPPYGKDLFNGHPTGRLSNGRLATDFIAEALGYSNVVRAFLDPTLRKVDLLHGVSFASAGSGYDDLTVNFSNAISMSKQLEYFRHYKIHMRQLVGVTKAEDIIRNAIFVLSMGSNDFLQNYYRELPRAQEFTVKQYQDYLISRMVNTIQELHKLGARRLAVVGLSPFGCCPLVKTMRDITNCYDEYNQVALSFNSMIKHNLANLQATLGMQNVLIDIYHVMTSAITNPNKYGFLETSKGCCGTGLYEYSETCRGMSTCQDPSKYVFWDAAHPTQRMYEIIAAEAMKSIIAAYWAN
ncbi:GDSL esterase/lipase At5g45950-like [Actinidia eriantha]|uniref:GDSL esterase/lipase At5g45950-like n=1 Tax=Actinidia eriantha TaxID=165200 RepID=UPI002585BE91|nr:GDSL esterase/lipase At5g45950-like [Actinidia eriantha]